LARERILLISYHAPPSNEVGAIRWASMARHFAEKGWGFDIIAADPASIAHHNESLLARLPPGTRLYGVSDVTPRMDRLVGGIVRFRRAGSHLLAGAQRAIDANEPDAPASQESVARRLLNAFHAWREYAAGAAWASRAAGAGRQLFDPGMHRWVISSGPPHMSHEGGRILSRWTGLPLLADFRDPWRFQEWVPLGPAWNRLAIKYERRVVEHATLIVTNVDPVCSLMQRAYPSARITTVTNGVDEDAVPPPTLSDKFIIGHPGTIYGGRDPTPLARAVAQLVRELKLTPVDLSLEFMGFSGEEADAQLHQLARALGIESFLRVRSGGPRPRALEFMASCTALVALQQGSDLAVPAKIFEYMRFPAWLLVFTNPESATAQLLKGTDADLLDSRDIQGICAALARRYNQFLRWGRPSPIGGEERLTRRFQTARLLEAMEAAGRRPR
jgi:hypothetical protein